MNPSINWQELIVGAFVGATVGVFIGEMYRHKVARMIDRIKYSYIMYVKYGMVNSDYIVYNTDIIQDIDNSDSKYEFEDIIITNSNKIFKFSIPENLSAELASLEFYSGKTDIFGESDDIGYVSQISNIPDYTNIIQNSINETALELIDRKKNGAILYNQPNMFGIYNLELNRARLFEKSQIKISLYETDYFTHRVMGNIYDKLMSIGTKFDRRLYPESIAKYREFACSFGIMVFLIVNHNGVDKVILRKRAKNMLYSAGKWHYSINEAFSKIDTIKPDTENRPSLIECFERALREESRLNINDILNFMFTDVAVDMGAFQPGMLTIARVKINQELTIQHCLSRLKTAKDGRMEFEDPIMLSFNEIEDWVQDNHTDLTDDCRWGLKMLLLRYKSDMLGALDVRRE